MKTRKRTISRSKAVEMIDESKGRFFTVSYTKKDNKPRKINCNHRKGAKTRMGYLTVWSAKDKSYKSVDPRTINTLIMNSITYNVK